MNEILSEKLRPTDFDDLILDPKIKDRLKKMFETKRVMNMIFYGQPGCGKTSAARIFTESTDFFSITLNGSLETSIESIRDKVDGFGNTPCLWDNPKICFIDEADYLSKNGVSKTKKIKNFHSDWGYCDKDQYEDLL